MKWKCANKQHANSRLTIILAMRCDLKYMCYRPIHLHSTVDKMAERANFQRCNDINTQYTPPSSLPYWRTNHVVELLPFAISPLEFFGPSMKHFLFGTPSAQSTTQNQPLPIPECNQHGHAGILPQSAIQHPSTSRPHLDIKTSQLPLRWLKTSPDPSNPSPSFMANVMAHSPSHYLTLVAKMNPSTRY